MDQLASLPVWAQKEIQSLRDQVECLARFIGRSPESNTTYGVESLNTRGDLPNESPVQFYEDRNSMRYIEAHMRDDDKHLYLVARENLVVIPTASNLVRVKLG